MDIKRAKYLNYGLFALFAISTFILMFLREPFFDEAHAWMVSKSFTFFELFSVEKYEGHLFLWHAILSPFSKNNFFYPYSMYIINWLFCIFAVWIFIKNSPFSFIQKTLIVFSYPFFWYFAQVARCYSIGILFLFLILSLWKQKLCYPILFSSLLILFANTSAMALIGAIPLGLIFIYDLIKSKQKCLMPFLILIFGCILIAKQLIGAYHPDIEVLNKGHVFLYKFLIYFSIFDFKSSFGYFLDKTTACAILALYLLSIFYFYNSKRALFFHLSTVILLLSLFIFKYSGAWWHYLFFYVYLISSIWIMKSEGTNPIHQVKKPFEIIFLFITFSFCITTLFFNTLFNSEVYNSKTGTIANIIQSKKLFVPENKVYALDNFSQTSTGILPYFKNAKLYNIYGNLKYTFDEYENYMHNRKNGFKIDSFANSLSNKNNYGISDRKMHAVYEGDIWKIVLQQIYTNVEPNFTIYEITRFKK